MIIYNTTYHVETAIASQFIAWLKDFYIPSATESKHLTQPQLTKILSAQEDEGESYSLQFKADSVVILESWYRNVGCKLVDSLTAKFGQKVVGFSTLMQTIEI